MRGGRKRDSSNTTFLEKSLYLLIFFNFLTFSHNHFGIIFRCTGQKSGTYMYNHVWYIGGNASFFNITVQVLNNCLVGMSFTCTNA